MKVFCVLVVIFCMLITVYNLKLYRKVQMRLMKEEELAYKVNAACEKLEKMQKTLGVMFDTIDGLQEEVVNISLGGDSGRSD